MKKLISIILSAVMLLSAVITVNAASFKDVKSSDWYYSSVNYVSDKGIMNGTSTTKFSPNKSLTRAMGVTLLYRVAGTPSVSGVNIPFTDVKGGQWYTDAVKWAYSKGIVTGKSSTFFHTNGNITRAEFATILNRYSAFMKYTLPVKRSDTVADSGKIPEWAFMSVWTMYRAEIINGRSDGSFDPNAKITRAEAAAMIERFMKAPKDGSSNNTNSETKPPVDIPEIPTTGKLVIKEKKYDYNGANVMILNVENQTDKNLNVTIKAKFFDANGKPIVPQSRSIEGFPANYRNYVIFNPGVKFDKFTYEVETSAFSGEALMKYITTGTDVKVVAQPAVMDQMKDTQRAELKITASISSSQSENIYYRSDFVLLDNKGQIVWIATSMYRNINSDPTLFEGKLDLLYTLDGILYENYVMPESLKNNCKGIFAIKEVSLESDYGV